MKNSTKVLKTETGPSQGDKARYRDIKSALFEFQRNRHHYIANFKILNFNNAFLGKSNVFNES